MTTATLDAPVARDIFLEPQHATRGPISHREGQILDGLSKGWSTEGVAKQLHMSTHTVRTHIKNALRKLEVETRVHACALYAQGLVDVGNAREFAGPCALCGNPVRKADDHGITGDGDPYHTECAAWSDPITVVTA